MALGLSGEYGGSDSMPIPSLCFQGLWPLLLFSQKTHE